MNQKTSRKFKGGMHSGLLATSWPFCSMEISEERLLLCNILFKLEYTFLQSQIENIKVKNIFSIFGHGIKIEPKDGGPIYFWAWKKDLKDILNALKELKYPIK